MIRIKEGVCDFCGCCVAVCPEDCIELAESFIIIDSKKCTLCGLCAQICPFEALEMVAVEEKE